MSSREAKRHALRERRAWNPRSEQVRAELFQANPFFDREDKAQVKYEMLRHRELDVAPLIETCSEFGFTRESYRHILERFQREGMGGLFERKRGRKEPVKAKEEVCASVLATHASVPDLTADELAARCLQETGVALSRRTVYRILSRQGSSVAKKKRRRKARRR